ncbi:FkbM family methyltransferase [Trichlorobacter lovleyi]|uniref:FkbM family methyltransferase n=2 Tax=Trichlorobacter lovleyi TaxID=313985 RepID=UPI00248010E5|nr:FkbM family methyltransferase [Trichlorobacter lovleyi]
MNSDVPVMVDCSAGLAVAREMARKVRFGNWQVQLRGLTIYCHDLLSFYMAAKDIFDHKIYDFVSDKPDPVIIDGGGHIGLFSLYAKQRYPAARITTFEPDRFSLGFLRRNLAENGCQDVAVVEAGLYNRDGELTFGSDSSDGSSLFSDQKDSSVQVVRLSRYLNGPVDFLKLNIEGAECDVIAEIEPQLRFVKEMVIEYHGFPEIGQKLHTILALLDRNGFRYMLHDFDAETGGTSKPPFRLDQDTRFFLLIHARQLFAARPYQAASTELEPVSRVFGLDRGTPVDRYYLDRFLTSNRTAIRGRVLEIADSGYTMRYGSGVTHSDVLSFTPGDGVTIVGDLVSGAGVPEGLFDCIILTQTIQMIYDLKAALKTAVRALRPGGCLLVSGSGISQISRFDMERWGEFWRFTDRSMRDLLQEAAPDAVVTVQAFGNLAAARGFLEGRAAEEFPSGLLDQSDNDYQLLITARLDLPLPHQGRHASIALQSSSPAPAPMVLLYHRVANDPVDAQLLTVTPQQFEEQLAVLRSVCRLVSLAELLDEADRGEVSPGTVAVTFDDGYRDNLLHALPLLEKYQCPATLFVTSGMLGSATEFWWDELEKIFLTGEVLPATFGPGADGTTWDLATPGGRLRLHDELAQLFKGRQPEEREQFLVSLRAWSGLSPQARSSHRLLSAEELKNMAASPWLEIGSHCCSHPRLASLAAERQYDELSGSKAALEAIIARQVRFLSYPYGNQGDYTNETKRLAVMTGYSAAIANVQADIHYPLDRYEIPRRLVRNWRGELFREWLLSSHKHQYEIAAMEQRNSRLLGQPAPVRQS